MNDVWRLSLKSLVRAVVFKMESMFVKMFYKHRFSNFRNKHEGERCFIIGNGPSLSSADLDLIKDEVSFAANSIFKIFESTSWRPTYYMVQDAEYATGIRTEISKVEAQARFISANVMWRNRYFSSRDLAFYLDRSATDSPPDFSKDFSIKSFEGYTVLYSAMQLAYYMGFKEIYLIGVDFSYALHKNNEGNIVVGDAQSNHFFDQKGKQVVGPLPNLEYSHSAYEKAKVFFDENGVGIFNATRGGRLEVFERKKLSDLFE